MKWTDSQEIALALIQTYPHLDPQSIRFMDLRNWVMALPGFEDDANRCGERILEAIQLAWINEAEYDA